MSDWVVPQRKGSSVRAAQCKRAVCAHLRLHDPDLIRATDNGSPLQDIRTAPVASRVTAATDLIRFSNRAATDWQSYNCSLFCCLISSRSRPEPATGASRLQKTSGNACAVFNASMAARRGRRGSKRRPGWRRLPAFDSLRTLRFPLLAACSSTGILAGRAGRRW